MPSQALLKCGLLLGLLALGLFTFRFLAMGSFMLLAEALGAFGAIEFVAFTSTQNKCKCGQKHRNTFHRAIP